MFRSLGTLLDLIFPPICVVCERGLTGKSDKREMRFAGYGLCEGCLDEMPWLTSPYCPRCSKPIPSPTTPIHRCGDCISRPPPFDSARSLLVYQEELFPLIHRMKYAPKPWMARFFGFLMGEVLAEDIEALGLHGIIPIPLHLKRLRQRGFNQAYLMARGVARRLGIQVMTGLLIRERWTEPQVGLSRRLRERNVRGAFRALEPTEIRGKRWLLVDDVYTTGSTLREAAKVLRKASAAEVHVLTLARVP